jgi:hypothetical protein
MVNSLYYHACRQGNEKIDECLISETLLTLHHQFTVSMALPLPISFPDESGLYTHAIGKLLHVCSKQKLS